MLLQEPCNAGWLSSYWIDGVCVTQTECFAECPLASAADALEEAAKAVSP